MMSSPNSALPSEDGKDSPPAFLDLAGLGGSIQSSHRLEMKRVEHERQRALQRKMFEDQMKRLEHEQNQELLSVALDPASLQHLAASAPTTPPRINSPRAEETASAERTEMPLDQKLLSTAAGRAEKRKSVNYATTPSNLGERASNGNLSASNAYTRNAGAKSMPASRRTSASSYDNEEMANLNFEGLSIHDNRNASSNARSRFANDTDVTTEALGDSLAYNAGILLDEQLDQEMQHAMRNLLTSEEEKNPMTRGDSFPEKLSTSSAALDLAPLSQTPPRNSFLSRAAMDTNNKASEWPQFNGPQGALSRDRRTAMTSLFDNSTDGKLGRPSGTQPASVLQIVSRRSSPSTAQEALSINSRSVPTTPLTSLAAGSNGALTAKSPLSQTRLDETANSSDISATFSRVSPREYSNPVQFGSVKTSGTDTLPYETDIYTGGTFDGNYNQYGFADGPQAGRGGSTALFHHHGSRYGLNAGRVAPVEKINGPHGPKHKRGEADLNRFAGSRLEDLQGEIPSLCKDQHGCRYLQKKLEEGNPDHRDMIFHETFPHFAELMTDPFGNYLCQKLLEYSTDEQRNHICESVAKDLVNISLNMHGTRAVQKMIDFLSSQRQADMRYNTQIHSIILALSLHVVTLIKDLNGNHVIQKCLNKLLPEDNQFIYNAVAANCVEVATHRHGCCVLQRCIDHASDAQRIQLVNEITFNALTLVQDPYGNYVVQYILDLNDNRFSDAVIRQFTGNVCALSVQKFSSNVIEKCVRVAEHNTRKMLVEEMLHRSRLEKLLRDSFGNYCVQTALDYAEPSQRMMLVEGIRPILPLIRNTPYGKRIQSKLQREQHLDGNGYGGFVPVNSGSNLLHPHSRQSTVHPGRMQDYYAQGGIYGMRGNGNGLHNQTSHMHAQTLHGLSPSVEGYMLQGNNVHNGGLSSHHSGSSFGSYTAPLPSVSSFSPAMGVGGLNDRYEQYQRTPFGHGGL